MATAARSRSRPVRETAKPRNDAYTGLLFISCVALVGSSILLYLDYSQYGGKTPPKLSIPNLAASAIPAVPGAPAPDAPAGDNNPPTPADGAAPTPPTGNPPAGPAGGPTP